MAKTSGLGQNLYIGGRDVSGDIGAITAARGGVALLDVTGIDKRAMERIGGVRDGALEFNSFYNVATDQQHAALKSLPSTDVHLLYVDTKVIGGQAAALVGKQINYDGSRGTDGSFVFSIQALANGYGLEWAEMLTAGKRTDTTATNGASLDGGAATSFGLSAYLQVFSFAGTSVTVTLEDSADNTTFAAITGAAFTAATGRTSERIQTATGATVRRYVRAVTAGTFTSAVFAVAFTRHLTSTL